MSRENADRDGVRYTLEDETRRLIYYPPCHYCGKETRVYFYSKARIYKCDECAKKQVKEHERLRRLSKGGDKGYKFQNAINRIENHCRDMTEYTNAIMIVNKKLDREGWYQSTEEMMVALELVKNKVRVKHQVQIGPYKVDFLLTDLKVVLEIDADIYHSIKREKQIWRDKYITDVLGQDWEVIRIDTKDINRNITKLLTSILKVLSKRSQLRKEFNGEIPSWYTEKAKLI
jgi:very-short-patch-repair endonuclease